MTEITLGVVVVVLLMSISIYTEIKMSDCKNRWRTIIMPLPEKKPPVNIFVSLNDEVYVKVEDKFHLGRVIAVNSKGAVIVYGLDKQKQKGFFDNTQIYKTEE